MSYYESEDLGRFAEVGKFRGDLMKKFFDYYGAAIDEEGALSRREKALIALAVAHVEACPYCIDAYTEKCLETGSNPEQMAEALHVAASMKAGVALVHGVQMLKGLERSGAE